MQQAPAHDLASIRSRHERARADFAAICAKGLKIDMTRGKPSTAQLDMCNALLTLPGNGDYFQADGGDTRNYFGSVQGLPEARELFSKMMGAPPERILIGNNASLSLMHDTIVYALLKGLPGGSGPWVTDKPITFLCPSPGYDRHFRICQTYDIKMVNVPLTGTGPDMDMVEELVKDPSVRGMWCVPKYSNPTGETYSDEVVDRLAKMKTGAPDFRLFWDNAYGLHRITEKDVVLKNILDACEAAGNPDRAIVFSSTSKITFAGGGLGMMASSQANIDWYVSHASTRSIGPDKLNQLRHVRFLKDHNGLLELMEGHRRILAPKFAAVEAAFEERLGGSGLATWTTPDGGYFVSVDVEPGCATRVVELAKEAGIVMVKAGAPFPYGKDPDDTNLRIAPSFPEPKDIAAAAEAIAVCIEYAVTEKLLGQKAS